DMESKSKEATAPRPEGARTLNAPLVEMNVADFIQKVKEEPTWQESERNSITMSKSDAMTIVLTRLPAKAQLKPHKANGTISVQVLEGKITFATEYERAEIEKGQMIALQPNITHSVVATTESFFLLTLVPDRI